MTIAQLERPGVQVIQEFRTSTPTFLVPSLQAAIMGPCHQLVEAVLNDGSLNPNALLQTPARIAGTWVGAPFEYAGVSGDDLEISVNNGPPRSVEFTSNNLEVMARDIRAANIPGVTARVEISDTQRRLVIETTNSGDLAKLAVLASTDASVLTALGVHIGQSFIGRSGYNNQYVLRLQTPDYPDPRGNLDELRIDYSSVRVFLNDGAGNIREASRTEAFLRGATAAVTVFDDGDGDNLSPYLDFAGQNFTAAATSAVATGNVDLTTLTYATDVQGRALTLSVDGGDPQTIVFGTGITTPAALVAALNDLFGPGFASLTGGDALILTSPSANGGNESSIRIVPIGTDPVLAANIGLTSVGGPFASTEVVHGGPFPVAVGDEVWVDGIRLGLVIEIPAVTGRLRLDTERLLTYTGARFVIVAKGLDNSLSSVDRPSSELVVDEQSGSVRVAAGLFRSTNGDITTAGPLSTYLGYRSLRLDVSPAGEGFNLLRYGSTTELNEDVGPLTPDNPLGLGMYFAMLNATGLEVTGVGVDEANDAAPEGTVEAYARSYEFLESKDVYAIAHMTTDPTVGQIGAAHVSAMSAPDIGFERILLHTPARPTHRSDVLVASGTQANVAGTPTSDVSTGVAQLQSLLAALGIPGPTYTESDNVFLEFEGDSNKYLVASIASGIVTLNDGPLAGNADGFYADNAGSPFFTTPIVDRPFTVKIRGQAVSNRTEEAVAYGEIAQGFANRRVFAVAPDKARASLGGLEQIIPGYYMAAALAGRVSSKAPQQPLTETSLVGFTGVIGSQDRYSEPQLRIMSGGGLFILYQKADGRPVQIRQQLSTDMSTVEKREMSITTALDFGAKFIRGGVRNFIGRFNIDTTLRDALTTALEGLGKYLVRNGVWAGVNWGQIRQPSEEPDALEIDAEVAIYYPHNKLRITLVV
jgi:hypothetical protein